MSGHSKWSQIKHRKGIADQKKGQVFSKLANKITIAAQHGADPASNYRLQSAIDEARVANVPKENIERATKRATEKDAANVEEIVIQAMGPGGIAVTIEAITDNKNRTINEIRHLLAEHEFKMVPENSLNWMFQPNWTPNETARAHPERSRTRNTSAASYGARSVPLLRTGLNLNRKLLWKKSRWGRNRLKLSQRQKQR